MDTVVITKSKRKDKKYTAVINDKKTIHFGQLGAEDYTIHKDLDRLKLYIQRHYKNEKQFWTPEK